MTQERDHALVRPRRRLIAAVVAVAVLAASGAVLWRRGVTSGADASAPARPAIPVTIATAARRDVPIYLAGLGTVQASNTTAIHTQIDGKLQSVNFTEGQVVHKGDVLAQIDPRLYQAAFDQAKAKKAADAAQLISAEKDLSRFKTLAAKDDATQQSVDQQQAKVDQLKATVEADQAAIESAQTKLDYTTIAAPTDGRVGIRQVDPGNIVHVVDTTPIVVLTQTRPVAIVFTLPEIDLPDVRRAMSRGPVVVLAYDQNDARLLGSGKLLLADNEIDQTTSTIKLKATFPNDDETLWPGEFVHTRLLVDTRKDAVTVPSAAVQRGPRGPYAWLVRPDGTVEPRPIDPGPTQDVSTIVDSGLAAGDRVVVNGQYRLQSGVRVDANPATEPQRSGDAP
jgi:membrane fusion protein, multidrug efflux system